jgi:hypothetical protein
MIAFLLGLRNSVVSSADGTAEHGRDITERKMATKQAPIYRANFLLIQNKFSFRSLLIKLQ